tara:strand:- start:46 stop:2598 length:2553 start_codon:yes stop_codon:yes gene_type:complete
MKSTIWTEKYRPSDFSDIKGQDDIVSKVKAFVEQGNMPHLMFSGPAGCGKTSLSLVIAKKMFGDGNWKQNFLELNASDQRGIDVIRNQVKDFARTRAIGDVPFKIIYLDECLDYNSEIVVKSKNENVNVKIGDFVTNYDFEEYKILSIGDNGDTIFQNILNVMKIPHQSSQGFYKIKIHDKEILATGNHEFLTIDGWKRVDQLKIKELVLCPQVKPTLKALNHSELKVINYNLIGLCQEIKKKEKYIAKSPEKEIIELLGKSPQGLTREEITKESKVSTSKITSILSNKDNPYYIPLTKHGIIKKEENKYTLKKDDIASSLDKLYMVKRIQNNSNQEYILTQLKNKGLYPLKIEKAKICARILGHLFSDGCLTLKAKQLFFSGKDEDLREIKSDINKLGYYALGNIRHSKWKNGECWSFGAYKLELLSLFYSLGAPVGKKTDNLVKIPQWIMEGDNSIKAEFLAAFLGGDGYEPKFQGRTVKPITVGISKREDLKANLIEYLKQIEQLFNDFGIKTKYRICPGYKSIRKDKTKTVEGRIWITNSTENIYKFLTEVGYRYCSYKKNTSKDVIRYLEWKKGLGKYVYKFRPTPHFKEWKENLKVGDSAYHYLTSIEKIEDPKYVYCLSTENRRFVANNIVVHNCDALTREAQQALRRTMENYTKTTRFILSCNWSSKIVDPIQSRCAVFKFKPLKQEDILEVIDKISKEEELVIDDKAKQALFEVSSGDCRRVENILQSCAALGKEIKEETIYTLASVAKPKEINEALKLALENKFMDARNKMLDIMLGYGLSGLDVIKQVQAEILNLEIDSSKKMVLIDKCGEIEFRMTEGSDEFIQLEALLSQVALVNLK